jgi:hypothetical protein
MTVRLFLENAELEAGRATSVIISVRNDTPKQVQLWSAVTIKPYTLDIDGRIREVRVAPGNIRLPDTYRPIVPEGLQVALSITGQYEEPVGPLLAVRNLSLSPLPLAHDAYHFFMEEIGGPAFKAGTYSLQASIYDKDRVIAKSNIGRVVVFKRE